MWLISVGDDPVDSLVTGGGEGRTTNGTHYVTDIANRAVDDAIANAFVVVRHIA